MSIINKNVALSMINESKAHDLELKKSNLTKLESIISKKIEEGVKNKETKITVSFCSNPNEDQGTMIFLISENRKSFDHVFDLDIMQSINNAGYSSSYETKRDGFSGVLHYIITINIE